AMARRGEQGDARALALEERVRGDSRPVNDPRGFAQKLVLREAEARGELRDPIDHAERLVLGRRRRLQEGHRAFLIDADDIGESAPDVDADPVARRHRAAPFAAVVCAAGRGGSPQPPPPPERTSIKSPGPISIPTSLVLSTREEPS